METLTTREGYLPETHTILERLGEDRLQALQVAIADHSTTEVVPDVRQLIESMVTRHLTSGRQELGELGYSTIADAIAGLGTTKDAATKFSRNKVGVKGAVNAHHARAIQAAATQSRAMLRELGTVGTPSIYVDESTSLHLVRLSTLEHCQYEGVSLVNCLGILATATAYLSRGALLYSLRENGTEPRVTLEVDAAQAAVIQARAKHDQPLHEDSDEYGALRRSLGPLAAHLSPQQSVKLTITDKVMRG